MFRLTDTFIACGKNRQPHSFFTERHTETAHDHAAVEEGIFRLKSVGSRHILNAPEFETGVFSMDFSFTFLKEIDPCFTVFYRYDPLHRTGKGIRVRYNLWGALDVELVEVEKSCVTLCRKQQFPGVKIREEEKNSFVLTVKDGFVRCALCGVEAVFPNAGGKGKLALERENFIGEMLLYGAGFCSEDDFGEEILLPPVKADIPVINGGDIPYTVTWEIRSYSGEAYLLAKMEGGTKTRALNREDRPGQYVAEKDFMRSPYVGVTCGEREERFSLIDGKCCFMDPNMYWECLREYFHDTDLPVEGMFRLDEVSLGADSELIFGYEDLDCSGYHLQHGGREFRFDREGTLLYHGPVLDGSDHWAVYSPEDKAALSLIPEVCWKREEVEAHIKQNHYFDVSEKISFALELQTRKDTAYLDVTAEILDVYEKTTCQQSAAALSGYPWRSGYQVLRAEAEFAPMPMGVYKIRFTVLYGGKALHNITHVFEVMDQTCKMTPAMKVGLPFMFSMPNEQKWLMRNSFDLWNPMASCDVEHYISCVTDTPIEAETRKTWEVIRGFKREWFAWLGPRTCTDFTSPRHMDVVMNADYLFWTMDGGVQDFLGSNSAFPFRPDHWVKGRLDNILQQRLLKEFVEEKPEVGERIGYAGHGAPVSEETYEKLMDLYAPEWIDRVNGEILRLVRQQNRELAEMGAPGKRARYGPISPYVSPTLTHHVLKGYGYPSGKALAEDVYTGFAIFEDYPFSCAYQTYRGPFGMMTQLLHCPGVKIYPEQYGSGGGGCIDGAVKFGHPPMGEYKLETYEVSTHAFEYVFNTAYRRKDGYHYWDTYGFHRSDYDAEMMDELIKDWWYALEYAPKKPLRSLCFAAEFTESDNVFVKTQTENGKRYARGNRSELAFGLLHECSREAGVPNGFGTTLDVICDLTAEECDVLVLPSMRDADASVKEAVRRLYAGGVNLVAVSDVTGLEDLFGVKKAVHTENVYSVEWAGRKECVYPMETEFAYVSDGAETVMTANGTIPAVLRTARTMLINADVMCLGSEDPRKVNVSSTHHIVGEGIRSVLADGLKKLSGAFVRGENVGVTFFETKKGETMLLAVDYTPYDNAPKGEREAVIHVEMDGVTDVLCDREIFVGKKNGEVRELRFNMRPHDHLFVRFCKG